MIQYSVTTLTRVSKILVVLACTVLLGEVNCRPAKAADWLIGPGLKKRLAMPVDPIVWSGHPLHHALARFGQSNRVAVLLDRRVDPGQKLRLAINDMSVRAALEEIARNRRLGVSLLGPVVYVGPPPVAARLRTLGALRTEEVRQLPAAVGRKFLASKRISWDDLATPKELLEDLAQGNRFTIADLELVPHDLWAGADLPPMTLIDRLTLILVQFDLTFDLSDDGKTVTLLGVPEEVALVRSYPGGSNPKTTAGRFAALAPKAQIEVVDDRISVKGLLEDHERIKSPRRKEPTKRDRSTSSLARQRFTLKLKEQPIGSVLRQLAESLALDLQIDREAIREAGISLEGRVSLEVKEVTLDRLLGELLKGTGLKFSRRGNAVEIRVGPSVGQGSP